ncbi:MAG: pyruvate kinase [Spirochaetes bacterium]|nr:pyruvate kinase [Spirochaetota bacterium]
MMEKSKTKIIATLGPASSDKEMIKTFIELGVDIFRLNFSHGDYNDYTERIKTIRSINDKMPIMADLKGSEIRTIVKNINGIVLKKDKEIELLFNDADLTDENFSLNYDKINQISKKNNHIMADDGTVDFIIKEVKRDRLIVASMKDGILKDRKGTHFIGVDVPFPILTPADKKDIDYALSQNVDFIAASMIKSEKEIYAIRGLLHDNIKLVAKIEHPQALSNIEKIIDASDMILVARGDLGVELPITEVPTAQKMLVSAAQRKGKPVIIATQLLDSMMQNPRPTRAEVSDIANAVFDKVDALMLTGESAAGRYPAEAVRYLCETVHNAEKTIDYTAYKDSIVINREDSSEAISYAAVDAAYSLKAKAILCFTSSGSTALRAAKFRPQIPIIAVTQNEDVARQLSIVFGIIPMKTDFYSNTDEMIENAKKLLMSGRIAKHGDTFVITAGTPAGIAGNTNMMKIIKIE